MDTRWRPWMDAIERRDDRGRRKQWTDGTKDDDDNDGDDRRRGQMQMYT